jgi:RimJ/RimL family protein N-acetyltransferase
MRWSGAIDWPTVAGVATAHDWLPLTPLASARLGLEPLRIEHAEEMARVLDNRQLFTFTGGQPATIAELRSRYAQQIVGHLPDRSQRWLKWVARRHADAQAVGFVQTTVSWQDQRAHVDVGWVIGTAYQHRGYAHKAAQLMLDRHCRWPAIDTQVKRNFAEAKRAAPEADRRSSPDCRDRSICRCTAGHVGHEPSSWGSLAGSSDNGPRSANSASHSCYVRVKKCGILSLRSGDANHGNQRGRRPQRKLFPMRTSKIIAAVAVAAFAAAGGSALTGSGVTDNAGASSYVGGTVNQAVTGAVLSTIGYTYSDTTNTAVTVITLTFGDAVTNGKTPTLLVSATAADVFTCTAITATVSVCTAATPDVGVTNVAITVP